jgi:hypothetical protein
MTYLSCQHPAARARLWLTERNAMTIGSAIGILETPFRLSQGICAKVERLIDLLSEADSQERTGEMKEMEPPIANNYLGPVRWPSSPLASMMCSCMACFASSAFRSRIAV